MVHSLNVDPFPEYAGAALHIAKEFSGSLQDMLNEALMNSGAMKPVDQKKQFQQIADSEFKQISEQLAGLGVTTPGTNVSTPDVQTTISSLPDAPDKSSPRIP